ncbi:hypothetical protein GCM10012289_07730 [Nonomuraea cavernae]|uniref:Uncharacterized protein n=1 Tax=Nonomuraea cavernae TaxID=2045107 RepID=A0A917YSB1_9ACTN|nr:hypothetical protein GCM10012289_07730 [Nonomuraea cavernae]
MFVFLVVRVVSRRRWPRRASCYVVSKRGVGRFRLPREQGERGDVYRTDHGEVPDIDRHHFGDSHPLRHGHY